MKTQFAHFMRILLMFVIILIGYIGHSIGYYNSQSSTTLALFLMFTLILIYKEKIK